MYSSVVFCNCTETEDEILKSVQRRALQIITTGKLRTPTLNLYNEVGLETPKERSNRVYFCFSIIIDNLVPDYLLELKPEKKKGSRYMLSTKYEYTPPSLRLRTINHF